MEGQCDCIDLHTHTTCSDGTYTPRELVALAADVALVGIAITDHDTTDGLDEALAAGDEYGVEVVPGVELSTWFTISEDTGCEVHILGYYMDYRQPSFQAELSTLQQGRQERNQRLLERLSELGIEISIDMLQAKGPSAGRAHVAKLLVDKGVAEDMDDAFKRFLGTGGIAYCPRSHWEPERAIRLICEHAGIAVLAHPRYLSLNAIELERWLCTWKSYGLRGLEACYSANTIWENEQYLKLARRTELLVTGGTDFHGTTKPHIALGRGTGNFMLPVTHLRKLKKAAGRSCRVTSSCCMNDKAQRSFT